MVWLFSTGTFFAGIPLAALITLQTLQAALDTLGYPAVTLFIMIESMGIPFPGETMLLLASFYAAINHHLQIPIVIACAALGAIIGDNLGYWIGRTGGRALVSRYGRFAFIKPEHIERAERFFEKHGNKTVFFGRFFAILRAWAAFLAGVNHMPWRTFLLYNAAGGISGPPSMVCSAISPVDSFTIISARFRPLRAHLAGAELSSSSCLSLLSTSPIVS